MPTTTRRAAEDKLELHLECAEAHDDIRAHARALRAVLEETPGPPQRRAWVAYLCLTLSDFTDALAQHFEFEETEGTFHDLVQHHPELLCQVRRLGRQHRGMLLTLEAVRSGVRDLALDEITSRLACLLERLELHEAEETELVQLAYARDLGAGG